MDCWDSCEVDSQFRKSFDCGSRMAVAGLGVSLLVVFDFITGLLNQEVGDESFKPPRANDGRDGRANLADRQFRIFPPARPRGLMTETSSSRN